MKKQKQKKVNKEEDFENLSLDKKISAIINDSKVVFISKESSREDLIDIIESRIDFMEDIRDEAAKSVRELRNEVISKQGAVDYVLNGNNIVKDIDKILGFKKK